MSSAKIILPPGKSPLTPLPTTALYQEKKASGQLREDLPFEDLGFAVVDHHRELRNSFAEVIFCQGKTPEQLVAIARHDERVAPVGEEASARMSANALARRDAEQALRESEMRLSLAADSAGAGLWTMDIGTGLIWGTEKALELHGFAPDEAEIGKSKKIVLAFEDARKAGLGVVALGTKMIDQPVVARAQKCINMAVKLGKLSAKWRDE